MIAYRLCKAAHVALDGEGARLWGGRWNSAGRPMVYTAATPSLAVLEVLVHLDLPAELLPDDLRLLTIEIPDDAPLRILDGDPADDDACITQGDAFLDAGDALALRVRSVVVPQEWNMLLNVHHADMVRVAVIANEPFRLDPRLLG
ncbi:RES family NAD+ phosphorylase [Sphingomonas fennica]|uniref:RES domain-containing protein n=1 Tax=Edaphosphingomonas fennica TaxID=114404 RepID=A0A2T4HS96_9SPHN|nr:RES family NAD+ phosphorylase [Sphingomonas fennica]PTD18646.1 RES domain-containing protein [Sphingomonas fennica]